MRKLFCIPFILFFLFFADISLAGEKNLPLIVESEYFSIYGDRDISIESLLQKIDFNYFLHLDVFSGADSKDIKGVLARTMDALYSEVSDILGINIYSYHGNIKFLASQEEIEEAFREYYDVEFLESSFYIHNENTLYVSWPDITLGIIGHEIAHTIISHYFVVPPPAKVQEVLSGYVEYNLRKSAGTLPLK